MAIIQRLRAAVAASEQAEPLSTEPEENPTGDGRDSDNSQVGEQLKLF